MTVTMLDDRITPEVVRDALRAIRAGGRRGRAWVEGPLATLDRVTLRLRAAGRPDSTLNRSEELKAYLVGMIWDQIVERHPSRPVIQSAGALGREAELLEADFAVGDIDLQAWSWLYYRYLADEPLPVSAMAARLGFTEKTLQRRLDLGLASLVRRLKADQALAATEAERNVGAPARERIAIVAHAVPRAPADAAMEMLNALRSDELVARISPGQAAAIADGPADDLTAYRLARIAAWSQPRHRLDERFVALSLLVDRGEDRAAGRWEAPDLSFNDLRSVLDGVTAPAVVLLGAPGSGKSTLLRRLELDVAIAGLRGQAATVPFYVQLNHYRAGGPAEPLATPWAWLRERWSARQPALPPLDVLLDEARLLVLLDGLNEMPHADAADYRERVGWWRQFLQDVVATRPGNRVVLTCRSLDYSAPLSTPALRVPQVRIEPLSDDQIRHFLDLHAASLGAALWGAVEGTPQLDLLRTPYLLRLLVDHVGVDGDIPRDRGALFTGFVRRALVREIERDNALFRPQGLLTERDYRRVVQAHAWRTPYELPERGVLVPGLARLAHDMQGRVVHGEPLQVRIGYDDAIELLGSPHAEDIVRAGAALGVLDEDAGRDEVLFVHQLLQEYFAARHLAAVPATDLAAAPWRAADIHPRVPELVDGLPLAETLPPLPQTGWEETVLLAVAMTADPAAFVRELKTTNLPLAARCARQPVVLDRLSDADVDDLRVKLAERSREPSADLRARIAAGLELGWLGDPRWRRCRGSEGVFLEPPLVEIPEGDYPIGEDDPLTLGGETWSDHVPRHRVRLASLAVGRFPVTHAEWACFIRAGGYDDERWWTTAAGRAWRSGDGTASSRRQVWRRWRARFRREPHLIAAMLADGRLNQAQADAWTERVACSDRAFERLLREALPDGPLRAPQGWDDSRFNNPVQPVVGICWHEALAFTCWLSAQLERPVRLLSEVEWEAAARGIGGRRFVTGDVLAAEHANVLETRIRTTTPVGVFPESDSPEGVSDLAGNVWELTLSRWGDPDAPSGRYPYATDDAHEALDAGADDWRITRGGGWQDPLGFAQACYRYPVHPASRGLDGGVRICLPPT